MNSYLLASTPTLAAFDAMPRDVLMIVFAGMLLAAITVVGGLISQYHREKLRHETIRLALEKSQPLPPDIFEPSPHHHPAPRPRNDRRTGLILIAVAVGIAAFLLMQRESDAAFVACIPAAIGCAMLFNAAYEEKERKKKETALTSQR